MKFPHSQTWILFGCALISHAALAQEDRQQDRQTARQSGKPAVQKQAGIGIHEKLSYEQLLDEADALIRNGKPGRAYSLLEPLELEHAGEKRFDYLIGIAALDSGMPDKATLALERALAVDPDFAAARLDLARAYYQLGDLSRAKTEFTLTLRHNPSAEAQLSIRKYLDAIAEQEGGKRTRVTGYVEGTLGHDSNVNNSTGQAQIFVDVLGATRTLAPTNVKMADYYYGVNTGGEIVHSLNTKWGLHAGADLRQRGNRSQKDFDSLGVDARADLIFQAGANSFRAGVLGGQYNLGDSHNRDTAGLNAEWRYALSPSNQMKVFGQRVQYRFADVAMQVNDFDQQAMGAAWTHVLSDGDATLFGSLYHGTEKDVSATIVPNLLPSGGRTDGAKSFNGMRIGGQTALGGRTTLFINAGGQFGDYSKVNPLFLRQRSDRLYDLTAGANWRWGRSLTLRPQLSYSRNNSNIVIYEYDRMDVSLTVRRDFR